MAGQAGVSTRGSCWQPGLVGGSGARCRLKEPQPCLSPHPLQLSALKTSCSTHSTSYTRSHTNVTISKFKQRQLDLRRVRYFCSKLGPQRWPPEAKRPLRVKRRVSNRPLFRSPSHHSEPPRKICHRLCKMCSFALEAH